MRRFLAAVIAAVVIAGCGGSESGSESARQLDPRSDAVVALDLDYDGGNWQQIKRLYERSVAAPGSDDRGFPDTLDALLEELAGEAGLSFDGDVRPLLGGTLNIGVRVGPAPASDAEEQRSIVVTAAYRVEDPEALARVLEKLEGVHPRAIAGVEDAQQLGGGVGVAGGDTIVAVMREDGSDPDPLLRERLGASDEGPELPELGDDLIAARVLPTVLGAWLDREELSRAVGSTAGRALRSVEASVRLEDDAARAEARVDFEGLAPEELPLPEAGPLALPPDEGVASASADQSRTTVFLAQLARELYPDSRFVRRVEDLERRLGLRFEDEVLRQFAGPSFSVLRPEGPEGTEFGARSSLRDPGAMRELLPQLATAMPGILEALEGLGSTGLASLLFVAPDAPLVPGAFGLLAAVRVSRLGGDEGEQLYEVGGLDSRAGPDRVVYGIVDDAFVVASSPELAREVATLPAEPAPEAATRLRFDLARLLEQAEHEFGADDEVRLARALIERAEASASAEGGDVVAEAELLWATE